MLYTTSYANVTPSFVVDISAQFEHRMDSLFAYESHYGARDDLFPSRQEARERLKAVARCYRNFIGVKYGEPFVVKEAMRVDDVVSMGVRSF